jgi:hypothetical protein
MKRFIPLFLILACCSHLTKVCHKVCAPGEECKNVCMTEAEWNFDE